MGMAAATPHMHVDKFLELLLAMALATVKIAAAAWERATVFPTTRATAWVLTNAALMRPLEDP